MSTLLNHHQTVGYAVVGAPLGSAGQPILLFHGTTMSRSAWDLVIAAMPSPRTYIQIEFPGSGESSLPDEALSVEGLVSDAVAVLDELKVSRCHVAGYSLGAVVAAGMTALAGDRVASSTLLCGWAVSDARMRLTFDLWKKLITIGPELFMRYAMVDGFTATGLAAIEPMVEQIIAMSATAMAPGSQHHVDLDLIVDISALLPMISAPTQVISGAEDRWVDPSHGIILANGIAGATFTTLPAGHLVIQELASDVAGLLDRHIADHDGPPANNASSADIGSPNGR